MRPTVLLVEDEPACRTTLAVAFEGNDAPQLEHTATAEQALTILSGHPVAVLITDIHLPLMDGLELIRRVRAESRLSRLPIIVTSADADPATHALALELGANAFFIKPYSPLAVRRKIQEFIRDS